MRKRETFASGSPTVQYINNLLQRHPEHSQGTIAENSGFGFSRGNILTQIKSGRTKIPISKIVPLCTFLGENPRELLSTAMKEYYPEIYQALGETIGLCETEDERELLLFYRERKAALKTSAKDLEITLNRLREKAPETEHCLDSILKSV